MGRLLVFLAIADLAVLVVALIDCLSVPPEDIRALPRLVWVLLIIIFTPAGGIAWFVAGRPVAVPANAAHGHPAGTRPAAKASRAPDDDPDFLRSLGGTGSPSPHAREDAELLRLWEEDLRRREDELRDRDQDKPDEQ